ncbi:MAG TPA: ubiquinone/menaquinone biosynthesis methyltransferase [Acidimicrobiia bacterium]|nr:ubiquinone/menaquinone biosynthesis methyltransferase [Acidimicrobiia bacterium]
MARASRPLPTGAAKRAMVETMFDDIAPGYDRVNRVISLGFDRAWRRRTVGSLGLRARALVLDVACGTGDLCDDLARAGYRPIGCDFSAGMLRAAHTHAPLVRADALTLPTPPEAVDGVACGFALRNFTDLASFLRECSRVLRPGGRLAALDAAQPEHRLVRVGHDLWFRRVVPWVGARLSGDADAYRYLPDSTAYLPEPRVLRELFSTAGFVDVERITMMGGAVQLLTGTRR